MVHAVRVKYERLWERLIESLDDWTSATEARSGQIEVALPHSGIPARRVLIVITPDEWAEMVTVMWGDFDSALQDVKRTLLTLQPDEPFAVYADYRLEPSAEPTLREPRLPPPGTGEWVVLDGEGEVVSRYADWLEPDEPG